MSDSIIQFARDFEKFKATLDQPIPLTIKIENFESIWSQLQGFSKNPQFEVYCDDFKTHFRSIFTVDELKNINFVYLIKLEKIADNAGLDEELRNIHFAIARLFFLVGNIEKGCKYIEKASGKKMSFELQPIIDEGFDEYNLFQSVYDKSKEAHPGIFEILKKIQLEWEKSRGSVDFEGANCLLVEKDNRGEIVSGKIQSMTGKVSFQDIGHKSDELSFNKQLKLPDDKFVGVIYNSFDAVRKLFRSQRQKEKSERFLHAHLHLESNKKEYTGDSIGLAAAVLTYVQLTRSDTSRIDKYVSSNVVFTGSIDSEGSILPVNEDSLEHKIEAAFFSPVKYIVLPSANFETAQSALDSLNRSFPHRKLYLIAADNLHDVITNHNIVRDEKLCLGPYLARQVKKHSLRSAAAFSLIFLLLAWYTLARLDSRHFDPWFDWRISTIDVIGNRYRALNPEGREIFKTESYSQDLANFDYGNTNQYGMLYVAFDFDQDSKDELVVIPTIPGREILPDVVDIYDHKGSLLIRIDADKTDSDISRKYDFRMKSVLIIKDSTGTPFILTQATSNSPALVRILMFNPEGDIVSGPYLHKGHFWRDNNPMIIDIDNDGKDEIINVGTNNDMERAGLVILNPWDLRGMSPPYDTADDPNKGSQLYYIAFPETPISGRIGVRNWAVEFIDDSNRGKYRVRVREAHELHALLDDKIPEFVYSFDRNLAPIGMSPVDASDIWFNRAVDILGVKMDETFPEMLNRLLKEVIVYQGDSIIYPTRSK